MKKVLSFLTCYIIVLSNHIFAQTALPEYGTPPAMADMQMKIYQPDKSAPAFILAENGSVAFDQDNGGELVMKRTMRKRVKIFNDKGFYNADVKIFYLGDDKYERITDISGYIYNLSENGQVITTQLSNENIIHQQETERTSSVKFSLPDVKPGSIFEYRYTILKKNFTSFEPWLLQHEIPTRVSSFMFEAFPGLRYNTKFTIWPEYKLETGEKEMPLRVLSLPGALIRVNPVQYTFTLKNIEAFETEPLMPGIKQYLQRLEFEYTGTGDQPVYESWQSIARNLDDDFYFGRQLRRKVVIPELEDSLKQITGYRERFRYIHQFVRNTFIWDGVQDYLSLNVKKINRERKGSTGDINLVLINLLQNHGIEAYPLLCSTVENGAVNPLRPNPNQFNTLNAIVKEGNNWHILNGADKYTPSHLFPNNLMNTRALLLKQEEQPQWIDIWKPGYLEKHSVAYMAQLDENGELSGNAYITSSGYARQPFVKELESGNDKLVQNNYSNAAPGIVIENFSVKNEKNDTLDLVQQFAFRFKGNKAGDYIYFNTNLFTGLEKNPFIAEKRVSDICFGHNRRIMLNIRIIVAENFTVDTLPQNLGITIPDSSISFRRSYMLEDNVISLTQELEFNRPVFFAEEYPDFKQFYKRLFEMLNEQIVLRKK
jgi:Domain of Unknown Function with PDB structure (DUF3857)